MSRNNRKVRMSNSLKGYLASEVRSNRKKTVYKMICKKHDGQCPCYVCGKHVEQKSATLEHIVPSSKGGSDGVGNLSISHYQCNQKRGNDTSYKCYGENK